MKRLLSSALLAAMTLVSLAPAASANVGSSFLPDLTFPEPVTYPDVSTQGDVCIPAQDATPVASCQ